MELVHSMVVPSYFAAWSKINFVVPSHLHGADHTDPTEATEHYLSLEISPLQFCQFTNWMSPATN